LLECGPTTGLDGQRVHFGTAVYQFRCYFNAIEHHRILDICKYGKR
jgi:hypothetical protein